MMLPQNLMLPLMQARSLGFTLQYIGMDQLVGLLPGTQGVQRRRDWETQKVLLKIIEETHKNDLEIFQRGLLPWKLLWTQKFLPSRQELKDALLDGFRIYRRRSKKIHDDLPQEVLEGEYPDYYKRNFHFQTDGYFSKESAERYDRQVEVLFSGTSDAMRRSWILPLLKLRGWQKKIVEKRGEGLKIMDLAAGPGSASQFLSALAPEAHLILQDLSAPYLETAQERLKTHLKLELLRGNAEDISLKNSSLDLILSVYLFHEVPKQARENILKEVQRLLKPGGLFIFVDSIQKGDSKVFDPLLKDFPGNYHEPFYMNYVNSPIEKLAKTQGLEVVDRGLCFASKFVIFRRSR